MTQQTSKALEKRRVGIVKETCAFCGHGKMFAKNRGLECCKCGRLKI